jgi:RNA polymerase sigma-70 factor, ECF subfamily
MTLAVPRRSAETQLDDNELMALVQGGSHDAFARLHDRYAGRAYRVARSVSTDDGRAQDAVQEGFASIWKARSTYRPEAPTAAAWVLTLVRHRAIDLKRRDMTRTKHQVSDDHLEDRPALTDVAEEAIQRLTAGELKARLNRLPEPQAEVIVLAFYGELTHSEIAAQLGVPIGTIKGRMRLGLQKLRAEIEGIAA